MRTSDVKMTPTSRLPPQARANYNIISETSRSSGEVQADSTRTSIRNSTTTTSSSKSGRRRTTSATTAILRTPTYVSPTTKPLSNERKQSATSARNDSTITALELAVKNTSNDKGSSSSNDNILYESSHPSTMVAAAINNYGMMIPLSNKEDSHVSIIDNNKRSIVEILEQADRVLRKIDQLLQSNTSASREPPLPISATAKPRKQQQQEGQQQQHQQEPSTQWNPSIHSNSSNSSSKSTDSRSNYIDGDNPSLSSYFLFAEDSTNNFTPISLHRDRNPVITPPLHGSTTTTNTSTGTHHQPKQQQSTAVTLPTEEEITRTCYRLDSDFLRVLDAIQLESTISNLRDSAQSTINLLHRTTEVAMAIQQENQLLRDSLHTPP